MVRNARIACTPECSHLVEELQEENRELRENLEPAPLVLRLQEKLPMRLQEARLCAAFVVHGFRSHQQLSFAMYPDPDSAPESNSITVRITYLRKKLTPGSIKNIHGHGYTMLDAERDRIRQLVSD